MTEYLINIMLFINVIVIISYFLFSGGILLFLVRERRRRRRRRVAHHRSVVAESVAVGLQANRAAASTGEGATTSQSPGRMLRLRLLSCCPERPVSF